MATSTSVYGNECMFHRAAGAPDLGAYGADLGAYGADLGAYGADMSDAEMAQLVAALDESERTHKEELAARQAMKVHIRQPPHSRMKKTLLWPHAPMSGAPWTVCSADQIVTACTILLSLDPTPAECVHKARYLSCCLTFDGLRYADD